MVRFDRYKALTFDCYGTLIDWESGLLSALRPVFAAHHRFLQDDQILEAYARFETEIEQGPYVDYKTVLRRVMQRFGSEFGFEPSFEEQNLLPESLKTWAPFPDTVEALHTLKRRYRLGILSNVDDDLFSFTAGLLTVPFDWVITAQQVGSYKPSLNNFNKGLARIALPKEQILHLAQSLYHDILPAGQIGLKTIWVNRRSGKKGAGATQAATATPDLEVPDLKTLVERMGTAL
ncbi:MAG: haloacid dehalogenase type II [Candidatus Manganitrophaceae bacterium]